MEKSHQAQNRASPHTSRGCLGCSPVGQNSSRRSACSYCGSIQTRSHFPTVILDYGLDESTFNVHPDDLLNSGRIQSGENCVTDESCVANSAHNTLRTLYQLPKYIFPIFFLLCFMASGPLIKWYSNADGIRPCQLDKTPFESNENTYLQIEENFGEMTQDDRLTGQICSPPTKEECTAMQKATYSEKLLLSFVYHLQVNTRQLQKHVHQCKAQTLALEKKMAEIHKFVHSLEENGPAMSNEETKFTEENAKRLIEESISLYDADKIGLPDLALESAGGRVVSTPETETYTGNDWITLGGFRLWKENRFNPRRIIQSSTEIGNCWAFHGSSGKIIIELSTTAHITAVTIDHIPHSVTLTSTIDSAPKDFAVYGIKAGNFDDENSQLLGVFTYSNTASPRQTFFINDKNGKAKGPFSAVKLWVQSNHGHSVFTCIYRFRVHGKNPV